MKYIVKLVQRNGFTVIELMGVLVILSFIILFTHNMINLHDKTREINQLADQARNFSQIAIRYIRDNYRSVITQTKSQSNIVIPYTQLLDYIPQWLLIKTHNDQTPCIYITQEIHDQIRAYLLFGNVKLSSKPLDLLSISKVSNTLGGNSGALIKGEDSYILSGGIENELSLPIDVVNLITNKCGFTKMSENTLVIDLSKDIYLFAPINTKFSQLVLDPSLKKNESDDNTLTTMQTNLYLDAMVKDPTVLGESEQHIYRSLDFGKSVINRQRIELKANASSGSITKSQLILSNAGMQAGYITLNSHEVVAGSSCDVSELGKMVQQLANSVITTSQLQCTYNPTFCAANGYCYLPIKSASFTYTYRTLHSIGTCPSGTLADTNQPSDAVITTVSCPVVPDEWLLIQNTHSEMTNCYIGVTGLSVCTSYQTICTYKDQNNKLQKLPVIALSKLKCTNNSTTFVVDNYIP